MWLWALAMIACGGAQSGQDEPAIPSPSPPEAPVEKPDLTILPMSDMNPLPGKMPPRFPAEAPEGACEYVDFTSTCKLMRIEGKGDMRRISVTGIYEVVGEGRTTRWSLVGDSGREADMKAHFQGHPEVECVGRRLVKGNCGAGRIRVMLPVLPPAQ